MLCDSGEVACIVSHHRSKVVEVLPRLVSGFCVSKSVCMQGSLLELPNGKQRWANLNKVVWVPTDDQAADEGKENVVGAARRAKRLRGAAKHTD